MESLREEVWDVAKRRVRVVGWCTGASCEFFYHSYVLLRLAPLGEDVKPQMEVEITSNRFIMKQVRGTKVFPDNIEVSLWQGRSLEGGHHV